MNKKGFTLVEMLVIISMMALLVSIIIIPLRAAKLRARDIVEKHNLSQIHKALDAYYGNKDEGDNKYPWDTYREPAPPWTWQNWSDTPCYSVCSSPNVVCIDSARSAPDVFLEQLEEAGYFTRDNIEYMTSEDVLDMIYFYTCDLQKYKLTARLSDGSCYEIGYDITRSTDDCPPK